MASSPTQRSLGRGQYVLPFPPSLNHYYRHVGPKVLISADGRKYRSLVGQTLVDLGARQVKGRLKITVEAHPPNNVRRDLDNLLKSLLDALQHAGLYEDDGQIDDLRIVRQGVIAGGEVLVTVETIQ